MSKDAKVAEKQRLAEALRANLRRRKVARTSRHGCATADHEAVGADAAEGATGAEKDGARMRPTT